MSYTYVYINDTFQCITCTSINFHNVLIIFLSVSSGTTEYGTQVQSFTPIPSLPSPHCTTPHCLTITTSTPPLLTGHTYYVTLHAQNAAGLSSHKALEGFLFIHGPPSPGRIVDLDPQAVLNSSNTCASYLHLDTDLIVDSDWFVANWEGFTHPHLNTTFSVGLGSIPGLDNVVPFINASNESQHVFANVSLAHGDRYYVTVLATNEYGSTTASSDGFLYLSDLKIVASLLVVADGNADKNDLDYQFSTSSLSGLWSFESSLAVHVSHYEWAVYRRDSMIISLEMVRQYENVGLQLSATTGGLKLNHDDVYIIAVQACLASPTPLCLSPVYSDGVRVLNHPQATSLTATYTPLEWNADYATSSYGRLDMEWSPFEDTRMAYYEWAVGTREPGYELLTEWTRVDWHTREVTAFINASISLHKLHTVTLQGYNAAGLYSRVGAGLYWNVNGETVAQELVPRKKLVVFDIPHSLVPDLATTDWRQLEHVEWDPTGMELDYTSSAHTLSAAWPDLRYTLYNYSVSTTPTFMSCDSPDNVACGATIANSISIPNLELENGKRYYVCVRGRRENAIHPSPSTPSTLTACSNGVTVDLSPPIGGCVEIRSSFPDQNGTEFGSGGSASGSGLDVLIPYDTECATNGTLFQVSTSDLHIVWSPFQDVEWYGDLLHATGVAYYEYAVGKSKTLILSC